MAENCARPRCGHRLDYHRGSGCFHFDAQPGKHCSCPSFRTQAQQEAWEETATAFVIEFGIDLDEGTAYAFTPLGQAVASLLELYP
jgi:hypothetical protein